MTYGPQPGWNPNQPPAGGPGYPQQGGYPPQPGYPQQPAGPQPTGPQPGYQQPMPGQPMPGQAMPGQPMPGQPMGQFAPYGAPQAGPAGPRSPLPVVAGAGALLSFVYFIFVTIINVLRLIPSSESPDLVRLVLNTSIVVDTHGRVFGTIMTAVLGLIAILFVIGAILLFNRKPSGRVLAVIAGVLAIVDTVLQIIQGPAGLLNAFDYVVPVIALILVVLCVLPATGQGLRRTQQAGYPQQPPPPIGYAQPPGGYQQPPGGVQR